MVTSEAFVHESRKSVPHTVPVEIGQIKPGQLLVKTHYASINPVDVKLHSLTFRNVRVHTLKDFAGTVVEVGADLRNKFAVGEAVCGSVHRASSETFVGTYTVVEPGGADWAVQIPRVLNEKQAASIGVVYSTAFELLERADKARVLGPDSRILVLGGSSSVGTYVLQLAKKYFGVGKVVATAGAASAAYAREFGADDTISYATANLSQAFVDYVDGQGAKFDAVLDCVGGYDALAVFPQILRSSRDGGSYVTISGDVPPTASYAQYMLKSFMSMPRTALRLVFGRLYGINYQIFLVSTKKAAAAANDFFSTPGVRVPIDSVYPLSELGEAWKRVDSTKAKGKVVIELPPN